jgi:hypothetical protein
MHLEEVVGFFNLDLACPQHLRANLVPVVLLHSIGKQIGVISLGK